MSGALRIAFRSPHLGRPLLLSRKTVRTLSIPLPIPSLSRGYASKAKATKGKEKDSKAKQNAEKSGKDALSERDKSWGGRSTTTDSLVPGSQQVLQGEAQKEYERADGKMKTAVDWFRREVAAKELQGSGRVTPDIMKPVRVSLPDAPESETCALMELATVGVRDGTTLLVTVFAEDVRYF